ncbi:MAG TPA: acetolactate synthase, partial [Patescibacteria group bacterium]|nr:acetolactate synthase [Patescibacteria group bacterium]
MNAFIVDLEDRPGSVAAVAEAIALKGISITSLAGLTGRGAGGAVVLTNDEAGTRRALAEAGFTTREVEVVPHAIEDRPGSFAEVARRLADAGVNLEAVLPT